MSQPHADHEARLQSLQRLIIVVMLDLMFNTFEVFELLLPLVKYLNESARLGDPWPWSAPLYVLRLVVACVGIVSLYGMQPPAAMSGAAVRRLLALMVIGGALSLTARAALPVPYAFGVCLTSLIVLHVPAWQIPNKWDPVWRGPTASDTGPVAMPAGAVTANGLQDDVKRAMQAEIDEASRSGKDPLTIKCEIQDIRERYGQADTAGSPIA